MRLRSGPPKIVTATVVSLSAALVLSSCTGSDDSASNSEDDDRIPQEDIDRLATELAEVNDVAAELSIVSQRLTRQCLEDQGHTAHPEPINTDPDQLLLAVPGTEVPEHAVLPEQAIIPETDVAKAEGAGVHGIWQDALAGDYLSSEIPDDPEWLSLSEEERDEYFQALHEQEIVDMAELSEDELIEHLEDDTPREIGGCAGLTNHRIYDSDARDLSDIDPTEVDWDAFPPLPGDLNLDWWDIDYHTPELQESMDEWNSCLDARGATTIADLEHLHSYVRTFYEAHPDFTIVWEPHAMGESGFPDPPSGAPWEFDEAQEQEIDYMTDVAECADESDLRETRQDAWDQTVASMIIEHEEEMYAWEEQLRVVLETAQELLSE